MLVGKAIAHILRGSLDRAILAALFAALALLLLWIVTASIGRVAIVRALLAYFREDAALASPPDYRWSKASADPRLNRLKLLACRRGAGNDSCFRRCGHSCRLCFSAWEYSTQPRSLSLSSPSRIDLHVWLGAELVAVTGRDISPSATEKTHWARFRQRSLPHESVLGRFLR